MQCSYRYTVTPNCPHLQTAVFFYRAPTGTQLQQRRHPPAPQLAAGRQRARGGCLILSPLIANDAQTADDLHTGLAGCTAARLRPLQSIRGS